MSNALGVVALATELGIAWNQIVSALAEFRGAARRFEVKYRSTDYMVVDDYAHHPTEIKATLAAAKNSGWKRVLALFQPHRYSRTKALMGEFAGAFHDADQVFITEIYAASEAAMAGITGEAVAEGVRADGHKQVHYEATLGRLRAAVNAVLEPGDLVITLGAGDIHRVAQHLAQGLGWYAELKGLLKPKRASSSAMSRCTSIPRCALGGPRNFGLSRSTRMISRLAFALRMSVACT